MQSVYTADEINNSENGTRKEGNVMQSIFLPGSKFSLNCTLGSYKPKDGEVQWFLPPGEDYDSGLYYYQVYPLPVNNQISFNDLTSMLFQFRAKLHH